MGQGRPEEEAVLPCLCLPTPNPTLTSMPSSHPPTPLSREAAWETGKRKPLRRLFLALSIVQHGTVDKSPFLDLTVFICTMGLWAQSSSGHHTQ